MKTLRLAKRHLAGAEIPSYHVQVRYWWFPLWTTKYWTISEDRARKHFEKIRNAPVKDIFRVLEEA